MPCPRCQQENPAQARFCMTCGASVAPACVKCGTELPAGAAFCFACGLATISASGIAAKPSAPAAYTPKHLVEKIISSKAALEGERKQVTVLFADLKGSMEILAGRDPEEARKILDPVVELMMEAVHRYEGTVNQVMGDGIMALFGAPLALEDHAVRACYAALRMQDTVKKYAAEAHRTHGIHIHIRVGLNSGEVVVRAIGSDLRMDYSAVGQTTHLAARMEQLAIPGTILATVGVLRMAGTRISSRSLGPNLVKGLPQPVEVFEIVGTTSVRGRFESALSRGLVPFVGRGAHVARLDESLEKAGAGHGEVVAVVGEAGVGKSRLFWEFLQTRVPSGWLVLRARSASFGNATAYLPIVDLLKRWFGIAEDDAPDAIESKARTRMMTLDESLAFDVPALLAVLGIRRDDVQWELLDPAQRRERIQTAIKRLVFRLALDQPLVLVFEDLHWIDDSTQEIIDLIVDALVTARILLLVNYRPEYRHSWNGKSYYTQLRLDPLQLDAAVELVESLVGKDSSTIAPRRLIVERTQGNPFFIEEIVQNLVDARILAGVKGEYYSASQTEAIEIPATVQAVLAARIDRLSADDKRVLQAAAVVGRRVTVPIIEAINEEQKATVRDSLASLARSEFLHEARLFPEMEYRFKHALTHEVAYATLLHSRKRALHSAVLSAMEVLYAGRLTEHAEALAHHAVSGDVWDRAVDHLRETSSAAFIQGALDRALVRAEQALDITARLPSTVENIRRAIDVRLDMHAPLFMTAAVPRLLELVEEARALAAQIDDIPRLGRASYRLGSYRWFRAEYVAALTCAKKAYEIGCDIDDPEARIVGGALTGVILFTRGDHDGAATALRRIADGPDAELAKRRLGASVPPSVSSCAWLAWSLAVVGEFGEAMGYANRAVVEASVGAPQVLALFMRSQVFVIRGQFEVALSDADSAMAIAESSRVLTWLSPAYSNAGIIRALVGRHEEGILLLQRAVDMHAALEIKLYLAEFYRRLGEGLLLAGRRAEAKTAADRAINLASELGERAVIAAANHLLGDIARQSADPEAAEEFYRQAKVLAEHLSMRPLVAHTHLGLGRLFQQAERAQEAREHLHAAVRMYREMGMTHWLHSAEADTTSAS